MIARFWTAEVAKGRAHVYADHLKSRVLPELREIDGYRGSRLLERETNNGVEIVVVTFWESLDSIRRFAGSDAERAVVSDDVVSLFLRYDRSVRHYTVAVTDDVQPG